MFLLSYLYQVIPTGERPAGTRVVAPQNWRVPGPVSYRSHNIRFTPVQDKMLLFEFGSRKNAGQGALLPIAAL
jgi:hypothetical protein